MFRSNSNVGEVADMLGDIAMYIADYGATHTLTVNNEIQGFCPALVISLYDKEAAPLFAYFVEKLQLPVIVEDDRIYGSSVKLRATKNFGGLDVIVTISGELLGLIQKEVMVERKSYTYDIPANLLAYTPKSSEENKDE